MNKSRFWQFYSGTAVVAILVIGGTIWWNFFSPLRPQDSQYQYASAQLVFTVVGVFGIIFSLLYATHQFARSQRKPDLKLLFSDSGEDFLNIDVPSSGSRKHVISFRIDNNGSNVAIWFEVIVDLSTLPGRGPDHRKPAWDLDGIHGTINNRNFIFKSLGRSAAFISAPLDIGSFTIVSDSQYNYQPQYELPYKIFSDLETPKHGKLFLKFNKPSVSS